MVLKIPAQLILRLKDTTSTSSYALQGAFENRNEDKTVSYQQTESLKYLSIKNSNNKSDLEWRILMPCQQS